MARPRLKERPKTYEVKIPKKTRSEAIEKLDEGYVVLIQGIAELRKTKITNHPLINEPRMVARKIKNG